MGNIEGLEDFTVVGLEEGKLLFSTLGLEEGSPVADFEGSIDGLFDEGAILGNEVIALEGLKVFPALGFSDRILVG